MTDVVETKLDKALLTIAAMRRFIDWLEQNPEFIESTMIRTTMFIYPDYEMSDDVKRNQILERMEPHVRTLMADAPMGAVQKSHSDLYYGFVRDFHRQIVVSVLANNSGICEYVETDEYEEVTKVEIPDEVVAEYTTVVSQPKTVRVCPKLFVKED